MQPLLKVKHHFIMAIKLIFFVFIFLQPLYGQAEISPKNSLVQRMKNFPTSMRCEDLEVSTLLRAMGRQAGINIFVSDTVEDTITFEMADVSLYEIFEVIIDAKNLHYQEKNNVIFVEKKSDFVEAQKDLETSRLCPKFSKASEYTGQLEQLKSPHGRVTVTSRDDCLIVQDRKKNIRQMRLLLNELDQPIPQVHIEARIVAVAKDAKDKLGVDWNYQNYRNDAFLALKDKPVTAGADLTLAGTTSNMAVGFIWDNMNLNFQIQALEEDQLLQILSAPSLLVLDGKEAEIKQGKEVPYTSQSGDNINTSFREANLSLKVTPNILQDAFINLDVTVTNDSVDTKNSVSEEPLINRQEITTNLFLKDQVTVVIGGIHYSEDNDLVSGVPILSDIPFLGRLFTSTDQNISHYELLIFITPTILSYEDTQEYSTKQQNKIDSVLTTNMKQKFDTETYITDEKPSRVIEEQSLKQD
jgi:type IV pilus assembly protein PilQ